VGCAICYNYVDLRLRNDTDVTFQLRVQVGERYLEGEVQADRPLPYAYSVYARGERFCRHAGQWFRRNEIWRDVIDRRPGGGRAGQAQLRAGHLRLGGDVGERERKTAGSSDIRVSGANN
jgi:vancomycin resistance protein VanW